MIRWNRADRLPPNEREPVVEAACGRTRHSLIILCCLCWLSTQGLLSAQDWQAHEGDARHHNSSPAAVAGDQLLWHRRFPAFDHPDIARREGSGYASRNLVSHGRHLAMIGIAEDDGIPDEKRDHYAQLTILDRHDGSTRGIFATRARTGCNSVSRGALPTGYFGNAVDVPGGFQVLHWGNDGRLLLCAGGDIPALSVLAPLPQLENWQAGTVLPVPGAFTAADNTVPDFNGRTRLVVESPIHKWPFGKGPAHYGLGNDWCDFRGSNRSSFFAIDPLGPLIALPSGGHSQGGRIHLLNKTTGLYAHSPWRQELGVAFAMRDPILLYDNILYGIGPAQDADGSGDLGNVHGAGTTRPDHGANGTYQFARNDPGGPDQGLRVWAKKLRVVNGILTNAEELFSYDFPSAHLPRRGLHDAYSYVETDGLQRDKALLLAGDRLWVAWKPSLEGPVSLCWADPNGSGRIDLEIGQRIRGQSIWPRMSLATSDEHPHIVYCLVNAYERAYLHDAYPWSAATGSWSAKRTAPAGPSQLAVIDCNKRKLCWTSDLSQTHPSLAVNDYWLSADRVQMLVAGHQAWIAWVDLRQDEAHLALAAYDLRAATPRHSTRRIPLGFASASSRQSYCTDLIAVDGNLYALITESDTMWPGAHAKEHFAWAAQHLVAVGEKRSQ